MDDEEEVMDSIEELAASKVGLYTYYRFQRNNSS